MVAIYHPNVIQIVPHYEIGAGHDAVNVLYFQANAAGLSTAQLTSIQTTFNSQWYTLWSPLASSQNKYKGSVVTDMSSNTGASVDNSTYSPGGGGAGSSPIGDAVCVLVSLKTSTRYRGGHGRLYLPGVDISETAGDGRNLAATPLSALNVQLGVFRSAMLAISPANGGPLSPIVWHKKWATAPNTVEVVNSYQAQSVFATQRRRIRKVSRHRRRLVP